MRSTRVLAGRSEPRRRVPSPRLLFCPRSRWLARQVNSLPRQLVADHLRRGRRIGFRFLFSLCHAKILDQNSRIGRDFISACRLFLPAKRGNQSPLGEFGPPIMFQRLLLEECAAFATSEVELEKPGLAPQPRHRSSPSDWQTRRLCYPRTGRPQERRNPAAIIGPLAN